MKSTKDVLVFQREKGRKLFFAGLQLGHQRGAFADVTRRLEEGDYDVLSGFISSPDVDDTRRCGFFLEASNGRPSADTLKKLLASSRYVLDVQVKEGRNGLLVDSLDFPLAWNNGDRAVMLRTQFFTVMEKKIRELLSSGADFLLYEMGYNHGLPSWASLLSSYQVKGRDDLREVLGIYDAVGWGKSEVIGFDARSAKAVVRVGENFECRLKEPGKMPTSNFVRGHLAGLFTVVFGKEVKVVERLCIAKGDPYCEFAVDS